MYFYTGPLKNQIVLNDQIEELNFKNQKKNISLEEKPLESKSNNTQIINPSLAKENEEKIQLQNKTDPNIDLKQNTKLPENI